MITVVVPNFNREKFILETIVSVQNQTYQDWELIIVDDGSTDNSIELIKRIERTEPRVRLIHREEEPKGAPKCRNIGIEQANGAYIVFLDSDDLMAPYCLEQRSKFLEEFPENDFLVFPMLIFKRSIDDKRKLTNYPTSENDLYRFLRSDLVWQTSQPIWKKEALAQLEYFDEKFPNCQDHDLHLRALLRDVSYRYLFDAKPDVFYRNHDGEKIYQPKNPLRVLKGINMLLSKLAKSQSEHILNDSKSKKSIFIFLFDATRSYTRNREFAIPMELAEALFNNKAIVGGDFTRIRWYIRLSRMGLNKFRGYERFWNLMISRKKYPMTWGTRVYKGDL